MTILINGVLPYVLYVLLKRSLPGATALLIAMLPALAENGWHWLRHRKADAFGLLMLGTFILGAALALAGGSEKLLLLRESLVTGAVGFVFLISLLFSKPLIFHLNRRFLPQRAELAEHRWANPYSRLVFRRLTLLWGLLLVAEAVVRVMLALRLSTEAFLAGSPFILYGFIGAAIACTYLYRRLALHKLSHLQEETRPPAAGTH